MYAHDNIVFKMQIISQKYTLHIIKLNVVVHTLNMYAWLHSQFSNHINNLCYESLNIHVR
jgi:hypothetical protein